MEPQEEPDWEDLWERIKADAEGNLEAWQAQFLEHPNCHRAFDPIAHDEYAERRAGKAFAKASIQRLDLANAINRDDIGRYIERWHPQEPAPPNGPAPGIVHQDEVELIYGTGQVFIDEGNVGKQAWSHLGEVRSGSLIARSVEPAGDPPAVGGQDGILAGTHQARQATTRPVLARLLCHCLLAVGRILSLLHPARRHR
jgi:hypothetical protein